MKTYTLFIFILTIFIPIQIPFSICQNPQYDICNQPFHCGTIRDITYPFWGENRPISCGYPGFELNCYQDTLFLNTSTIVYRVLDIHNTTRTLRICRNDLLSEYLCPRFLYNTTLNFTTFDFSSSSHDQNITLYYGCTPTYTQPPDVMHYQFECNVKDTSSWNFYLTRDRPDLGEMIHCKNRITVPVNQTMVGNLESPVPTPMVVLQNAVSSGFSVEWTANNGICEDCVGSGGLCGYNPDADTGFACYCADRNYSRTCNNSRNDKSCTI